MNVIVPTTSLAATIQGVVFKDLNGNGQREADDPAIVGQGIGLQNIYAPDWQPIPEDSLNPSDAEGNYAYHNLPGSTFRLFLSQPNAIPADWKRTTPTSTLVIIGENDTRQVDLGFVPPNVPPVIGTIPDVTASKSKSPVALQVNFTDADTSDTHQCNWQFGDNQTGSSNAIQNLTEPLKRICKIDHSYDAPGTYQVELIVTDSNDKQANTTFNVNVPNTFPTVELGKDMSVNKATPVQFTGTVQDHDGDEITTMWSGSAIQVVIS